MKDGSSQVQSAKRVHKVSALNLGLLLSIYSAQRVRSIPLHVVPELELFLPPEMIPSSNSV